ncbi:MAG: hypothetical protein GQ534_11375 [Candidatus Delongbacteria bacterium]|nr:hypothetical protein [Candidatus Delongbacteria bacterium]
MDSIEQYEKIRPKHIDFKAKLLDLIKSLLDSKGINYHLVEGRVKSTNSFADKIKRKGNKYPNPLNDIKDLVGLRIIVYYQRDIDIVNNLLRENFRIDEENTVNKSLSLNDDQFGYLSNHYVVKLKGTRAELPEWNTFKTISAEIQLRTVLQHSWAAISHELQYKSKSEVPSTLKRRLYRLAGLFELADEEFGTVKKEQQALSLAIQSKKEIANKKVYDEINYDTLVALFKSDDKTIAHYSKAAKESGFVVTTGINKSKSNQFKEGTSEIIYITKKLNILTMEDLLSFLKNNKMHAQLYFHEQYRHHSSTQEGSHLWYSDIQFCVQLFLMLFLSEETLNNYIGVRSWEKDIYNRIKNVILDFKASNPNIK